MTRQFQEMRNEYLKELEVLLNEFNLDIKLNVTTI